MMMTLKHESETLLQTKIKYVILKHLFKSFVETLDQYQSTDHKTFFKKEIIFN